MSDYHRAGGAQCQQLTLTHEWQIVPDNRLCTSDADVEITYVLRSIPLARLRPPAPESDDADDPDDLEYLWIEEE